MDSYAVLATYYNRFTEDVAYTAWADYLEEIFRRADISPQLVLDLACGTGTMTALLAKRGYEMIGVDASTEMLSQAANETMELPNRPLLIHQRMQELCLHGLVDACICCLDSVNYVTSPSALQKAFDKIFEHLIPGGIFIFDINTPKKFADIAGQSYVREDGDVYCVWQCLIADTLCTYDFDIFEHTGKNNWKRSKEMHKERIYQPDTLCGWLQQAGFVDIEIYPELSFDAVKGDEMRLFFVARKETE